MTVAQLRLVCEDRLRARRSWRAARSSSSRSFWPLELREPAQLHVEDVLGLDLGELERLRHAARVRAVSASSAAADQGDDRVDHVERLDAALDDVQAFLALLQAVLACAAWITSTWCAT